MLLDGRVWGAELSTFITCFKYVGAEAAPLTLRSSYAYIRMTY